MPENDFQSYALSKLIDRIQNKVTVSDDFINKLTHFVRVLTVENKQYLIKPGKLENNLYFIAKGCFSMSRVNNNGEVKTVGFYIENVKDYIICPDSYYYKVPTAYQVKAHERSIVISISKTKFLRLLNEHPEYLKFCSTEMELYFYSILEMHNVMISSSKEEILETLLRYFSLIFQKFPSWEIAEFIGITPEWLSKLRKKILQKAKH